MSYTIAQAARMTGLSPSAIRYYDKEGLLPQVERKNGIRMFSDMDIRWLHLLTCLENTGMPIKRIREYAEMAQQGDETLKERQLLIQEQRQFVQDQMDQLMYYMQELDFKDWYYKKALSLGSESKLDFDDYERETGKRPPNDPNKETADK